MPIALAGVRVIGVDSSAGMLERLPRATAEAAGVADWLDLRQGDLRRPAGRPSASPLVTAPFRSLLHLENDEDAARTRSAPCASLLAPGGRFVFDVFAPSRDDIDETHGRWLEREPGIWERADWDEHARRARPSTCAARTARRRCELAWLPPRALGASCSTRPASRSIALLRLVRPPAVRRAARTRSGSRGSRGV